MPDRDTAIRLLLDLLSQARHLCRERYFGGVAAEMRELVEGLRLLVEKAR